MCTRYPVDLAAFERTYFYHCRQKGVKPMKNPNHVCKRGKCTFWTHPRAPYTYMCEASSTIHKCGPFCNHPPIETPDADLVCPLTGIVLQGRVSKVMYCDTERTLMPTDYSAGEQRDRRWRRWELQGRTTLKRVVGVQSADLIEVCLVIYEELLKKNTGFFRNSIKDFSVFCLAICYLCKKGIPQAGLPSLYIAKDFPDPQKLPEHKINLTYFNKSVRHLVKQSQTSMAKDLFLPLNRLEKH